MRHRHHVEGESGICDSCGDFCTAKEVDMGIGSYEFWGARGVHHDWQMLSPCCEAEVVPGGSTLVRNTVHVARKDHKDGKVKVGQRYQVTVYRNWRKDGPSWFVATKRVLQNVNQGTAQPSAVGS